MQRPLEIAFRDLDPSDFIRNLVEERVDRLERFHPHIIGCRVVVEAPHRSAEGHNPPIGISVEVDVPARPRIIAKDAEAQRAMKGDHLAAINRAFEAVERQLEDLKDKQRGMDAALAAFSGLVKYEVGEVTAAATFYMAEVYADFSRSLLESERPATLKDAALQKYNDQLEEEAFPFEEKAIQLHEKNLELMAKAYHGEWTDKSLARLAVLKPGRYAKAEISTGFLGSIDRYEYRKPALNAVVADSAVTDGGANAVAP